MSANISWAVQDIELSHTTGKSPNHGTTHYTTFKFILKYPHLLFYGCNYLLSRDKGVGT